MPPLIVPARVIGSRGDIAPIGVIPLALDFRRVATGYQAGAAFRGMTWSRASCADSVQTGTSTALILPTQADLMKFGRANDAWDAGLLIEGPCTNEVPNPRDLAAASWLIPPTSFDVAKQTPFGTSGSFRVAISGATVFREVAYSAGTSTVWTQSQWVLGAAPNANLVANGGAQRFGTTAGSVGAWGRIAITGSVPLGPSIANVVDARDQTASGGLTAGARDVYVDAVQREARAYATSFVPSGTRAGAQLQFPTIVTHGLGRVSLHVSLRPMGARTAYSATTYLWYVDASNYASFVPSTGVLTIAIGGATNTVTLPAWAQYDLLDLYVGAGGGVATLVKYRLNGGATVTLSVTGYALGAMAATTTTLLSQSASAGHWDSWLYVLEVLDAWELPPWADLSPYVVLDAENGLVIAGDRVSGWTDASGGGRSFTQTAPAERPYYRATSGPEGGPCVEVGPDAWLQSSALASAWRALHESPHTALFVVRPVDADPVATNPNAVTTLLGTADYASALPGVNYTADARVGVTGGNGLRTVAWKSSAVLADYRSTAGAIPPQTWTLAEFRYEPSTAPPISVRSGGIDVTNAGTSTPAGAIVPDASDPAATARIGRLPDSRFPTYGTRHQLAYAVVYSGTLTSAELAVARARITTRFPSMVLPFAADFQSAIPGYSAVPPPGIEVWQAASANSVRLGSTSYSVLPSNTADLARFGRADDSWSVGLVIEPQRANVAPDSNDFAAASWTTSGTVTVPSTTEVSPRVDVADASRVQAAAGSNYRYRSGSGYTPGTVFTVSRWTAPYTPPADIGLPVGTSGAGSSNGFDLAPGATGWKRLAAQATVGVGGVLWSFVVDSRAISTIVAGARDWLVNAMQIEVGKWESEYIPTSGGGGGATRGGTRCVVQASRWSRLGALGRVNVGISFRAKCARADIEGTPYLLHTYDQVSAFFDPATGVLTLRDMPQATNTCTLPAWAKYDRVRLLIAFGNGVASSVKYSINGGVTVSLAITGSPLGAVWSGNTAYPLFAFNSNNPNTGQVPAWGYEVHVYPPTLVPSWAA